MTDADQIWNRALDRDVPALAAGDRALSSLLRAHGLAMNGGVLHAVELLSSEELARARDGYAFFGLSNIADLFLRALVALEEGRDLGALESRFDQEYEGYIPDDSALFSRFESHFRSNPGDFAP